MSSRIARIQRAIKAYYNWDNEPTNPVLPMVELGPDIDDVIDYSTRERGWMGTFLGGKFFPLAPRAAEVAIEDIAHGLAMTCRYGGQCNRFYSVAEHCVHVSHMVDPKYALHGLLHDSAEAYIGDMIRPLKHQPEMIAFRNAEEAIELEVAIRFGLHWSDEAKRNVKNIDNRILADEVLQLQTNPQHYEDVLEQKPLGITLPCWNPSEAEQKFIWRYLELHDRSSHQDPSAVKPVDQTSFGWEGNCFSACIASILELPIESVPQMMTLEGINDTDGCSGWWDRFCKWCDANNVEAKYIGDPAAEAPAGYCIKTGRSPRNPDRFHAVVALDGVVVHDPHVGDRRGVNEHLDFITVEYRK